MVNTDPRYIPKELEGPGYTEDRSIVSAHEAQKEQLTAALKYWEKEYDWALGMAKDWFPAVLTRCDNDGFNFYVTVQNGKMGRELKEKEYCLEGAFWSNNRKKRLSFNAYSRPFAESLLITAFKAAERAWSVKTPIEEGLHFTYPR